MIIGFLGRGGAWGVSLKTQRVPKVKKIFIVMLRHYLPFLRLFYHFKNNNFYNNAKMYLSF